MKIYLILIIINVLFLGCNNVERTPKYGDFENDWERDNLYGKIKTLDLSKANVINFETGATEEPILYLRKKYTEFGKVSYQEDFNNFGELQQYLENDFDSFGNRIKSISEDFIMPSRSIELCQFNEDGRQIYANVVFNDTLALIVKFEYDYFGNLISQMTTKNGDTSNVTIEYKYSENNQMLWKRQANETDNKTFEYLTEFKYDNSGNLIEVKSDSEFFGEIKYKYDYDHKNRLIKTTKYLNSQIDEETSFDKHFNPTSLRMFNNGEFTREIEYSYSFDRQGNWTEKRTHFTDNKENNERFFLVMIERRSIEYY